MALVGLGDNHLPLIYVRDAARGLLLASQASGAIGRTYVLVSDEPVTQCQFLGAIARELGVPAPTRHVPYELVLRAAAVSEKLAALAHRRQPPPVMRYGLQLLGGENRFVIARARQELSFRPETSVEDGVRRSVRWYREALGMSGGLEVAA
jgi:nucleoside-diphosphate-sugar epimerase